MDQKQLKLDIDKQYNWIDNQLGNLMLTDQAHINNLKKFIKNAKSNKII